MCDPSTGGAAEPLSHDHREAGRLAALEAEVARLRRSEAHYRAVVESARGMAILATDLDGRITSWNPGAEALLGWPEAEALGKNACMIFTPEDWARGACDQEMRDAAERGRVEDERWHIRKDGSRLWAPALLIPFNDPVTNEHVGYLKVLRDRTAQHEANEAARIAGTKAEALAIERSATLNQLAEGVIITDASGRITFVNRAAAELHGVDRLDVAPEDYAATYRLFTERGDPYPPLELPLARAVRGETVVDARWRIRRADGTEMLAVGSARPVLGADGVQTGAVLTLRDDTARHEAQAALAESERRFRNLADHAPVMMWVTDPDGYCSYLNRSWYEFTGQSEEEALGLGWTKATHPDDQKFAEGAFLAANAARGPFRIEYRLRRADGVYRWAIDAAAPRFAEDGTFLGHIGSVIDIDERREAEERSRESEARLRTLTNSLPAFVWFATPDGALRHFNDRWYEYTGQTPKEALPDGWATTLHPDDVGRTAVAWADARARVVPYEIEIRYRRRDGAYRWYVARAEPVRDEDGTVTAWFGTSIDIDDRKRAEAGLQNLNTTLEQRVEEALAERKLWADVFESSDALICALSPNYQFLALNRSYADEFERIFGVRPELGDNLAALLVHMPEHRAAALAVWDRALAGEEFTVTEEFGDPERARPCYELRFNPLRDREGHQLGAFQYAVDITERLRAQTQLAQAEEQLRQAQKMEAVGQLTGGLAHDFNNLLTGIIGSLEMMQRRIAGGQMDRVERYATAAITSANRAAALTHRLLAFARRQPLDPKPVNANRLVTGMEELLRRTIGEAIRLEIVTAGGLWQTRCDPHQLESAILNLAINARDAMPGGGKLTIETCNAHLDSAYAARSREVRPGQYVCICVTDTGMGMSSDVIARAFEPFFTTKPLGQGTGLGLSMIYGFARQSEGYAKIYSEPDQGTTVKLYLPRYYGEAEDADEGAGELGEAHRAEHGEVVLVVEDETAVRDLVVDVLGELGYRAVEAADGPSGLKLIQSDMQIDLLVTDVGLPGLNGRQLADAARRQRPKLKVLFMTGYAENATIANGFLEPGMQMITKPFPIEALATRIRDIIGTE